MRIKLKTRCNLVYLWAYWDNKENLTFYKDKPKLTFSPKGRLVGYQSTWLVLYAPDRTDLHVRLEKIYKKHDPKFYDGNTKRKMKKLLKDFFNYETK